MQTATPTPQRRLLTVAAIAITMVLTVVGCSSPGSAEAPETLELQYSAPPASLDPWSQAPQMLIEGLYDSLTHVGSDGQAEPWLATDWEYETPTRLVLTLHDDVFFSDGTPFTADVVIANLTYAQSFSTNGAKAVLSAISSMEARDEHTLQLDLAQPSPDLPLAFANSASFMVNPSALSDPEGLKLGSDGTGPYELDNTKTVSGQKYVMTRKADYWSPDTYPFDTVTLSVIDDSNAALNALKTDRLDVLAISPGYNIAGLTLTDGAPVNGQGIALLDINGEINPAIGNVKVRQALNFAVDRQAIIDTIFDGAAEVNPSIPASSVSPGWSDELQGYYTYDVAKAKKLLAEAGYADGFDLKVLSTPLADTLIQAIAGDLRDIGVNVEIEDHTTDLLDQALSGTWAAGNTTISSSGSTFLSVSNTMLPSSFFNFMKIDDPKIAAFLSEAASSDDPDAVYAELLQYAAEQAWYIVPAFAKQRVAYNDAKVEISSGTMTTPRLYHVQSTS